MRRRRALAGAAVAVVCALAQATGALADDSAEPLTIPTEWGVDGDLATAPPRAVPLLSKPPRDVTAPRTEDAVAYAEIRFACGDTVVLAVESEARAPRIWVDRDGDRDLSDETAARFDPAYATHAVAATRAWYVDQPHPQPVTLDLVLGLERRGTPRLLVTSRLARHGWIVLAGRKRSFALVDANTDLAFDGDGEGEGEDGILLDVDGDGWLTRGSRGHEFFEFGRPFRVGDEGWVARSAGTSGATVRFERLDETPPAKPYHFEAAAPEPPGFIPPPAPAALEQMERRFHAAPPKDGIARITRVAELGRLADAAVFEILLEIAETDTDQAVRRQAVFAMGHPGLVGYSELYLENLLRKGERWAGAAAPAAIHAQGGPDAERLLAWGATEGLPSIRPLAARYLGLLGTDSARKQSLGLFHESQSFAVREQSYASLRVQPGGPPAVTVRQAAGSDSGAIWRPALLDLALLGHPDAPELARAAIGRDDASAAVLDTLIRVLGAQADGESMESLFTVASRATLALRATERLSDVRGAEGVRAVERGLGSENRDVRLMAARALGRIPLESARSALADAVGGEPDHHVAWRMVQALGRHADTKSLRVLFQATRHRDATVRFRALEALVRTAPDHDRVRQLLANRLRGGAGDAEKILALDTLAAVGDERTPRLALPEIAAESQALRLAALHALERMPTPLAVDALIRRLENENETLVRLAVGRALTALAGEDHGIDVKRWKAWRRGSAELPTPPVLLPNRDADTGNPSIWSKPEVYFGIPLWSRETVFVIDSSGPRMHADVRWPRRLAGIRTGHQAFRKDVIHRFAMKEQVFDDAADPWRDRTLRGARRGADLSYDPRPIDESLPTNLGRALAQAFERPGLTTVVVVTDGNPARGPRRHTDEFLDFVRSLNQARRVIIHVLSVGSDSALLRRLAAENGGEYVVLPADGR